MRTPNRILRPVVLLLTTALMRAQVDVLTQHNDNSRSGANPQEKTLNTSNVNTQMFGKLAFRLVDGNVYAQPLIVSQGKVANRADTPNVVIVATEHNSVFAFDAEDTKPASTTAQLWHTGPDVLGQPVPSKVLSQDIVGDFRCVDLTTEIGITSTPVISLTKTTAPKEGVIFVVAKSLTGGNYSQTLFALSLADGQKLSSTLISGDAKGTGIGATGPPGSQKITFDPRAQLNRPGLLLNNNTLYITFGGHCDLPPFHGWVFAYDVSNPMSPQKLDAFTTSPNGAGSVKEGQAGIWMSGQGPAADAAGNIFFATGNGTSNGTTDFGDSVVKIKLAGGKIQVQDWFTPGNQEALKIDDIDLGSAGPVPIPNSHLLTVAGKEGRMYLLDGNKLGRGVKPSLHSFQITNPPVPRNGQPDHVYWNIHGSPIMWARSGETFAYLCGEEDHVKQYRLIPDTGAGRAGWKFESDLPFAISRQSAPFPQFPVGEFNNGTREPVWMPGGFLSLSSDGVKDGTGIIWVTMPFEKDSNKAVVRGILRAFDAVNVGRTELWESAPDSLDGLGMFAKFVPPTVANGKVYVPASQEEEILASGEHVLKAGGNQPALAIYGLK